MPPVCDKCGRPWVQGSDGWLLGPSCYCNPPYSSYEAEKRECCGDPGDCRHDCRKAA